MIRKYKISLNSSNEELLDLTKELNEKYPNSGIRFVQDTETFEYSPGSYFPYVVKPFIILDDDNFIEIKDYLSSKEIFVSLFPETIQ
jgi:hypothetical protein